MQPESETCVSRVPANGNGPATLLCVGNDEALLSYRGKVLAYGGFQVVTVRPQPEQQRQFTSLCRLHGPALVVACHTLTAQQRMALARELREACPGIKLLALTNGSLSPAESAGYDLLLDSLDGPAALIREIQTQI